MRNIGEIFRAEREARGMSYKDVEVATGIRAAYVAAIENGEYKRLPGEVFLRGFIRSYAGCLGLNPDEMIGFYKQEREQELPKEEKQGGTAEKEAAQQPQVGDKQSLLAAFRLLPIALAALTAGAVIYGGYFLLSSLRPAADTVKAPVIQSATTAIAPAVTGNATLPTVQSMVIQAQFTEACWVQVVVDGKEVFEGMAEAGKSFTWSGKTIEMHLGNAGAAVVQANGQPAGRLGERGEVVRKTFSAAAKP